MLTSITKNNKKSTVKKDSSHKSSTKGKDLRKQEHFNNPISTNVLRNATIEAIFIKLYCCLRNRAILFGLCNLLQN